MGFPTGFYVALGLSRSHVFLFCSLFVFPKWFPESAWKAIVQGTLNASD